MHTTATLLHSSDRAIFFMNPHISPVWQSTKI